MRKTTPGNHRNTPKFIVVGLVVLVVVTVIFGGCLIARRHQINSELNAVRESISFPDGWTILEEHRESPAWFGNQCNFGATRCPSISIKVSMPSLPQSANDLQLLSPSVPWNIGQESCTVPENYSNSNAPLCSVTSQIDQWSITVQAASVAERGSLLPPHTATITIEPFD